MTPSDLIDIGKRLFGNNWRVPLAAELGVNRETVGRWARGEHTIPPYVALAIEALKQRKVEELTR
jgi:DNA-binding transcriptional regulator YdaS (Cro superfamily)